MFGNQEQDSALQNAMSSMSQEEAEEIVGGFDMFIQDFDLSFEDETLTQEFVFEVGEDVDKEMEEIVDVIKDDLATQKDAHDDPEEINLTEDFEIEDNKIFVTLVFDEIESQEAKFVAFQTLIMDQVGEQPQQVAAFMSQVLQPTLTPRLIASLKMENQRNENPDYIG